MTTIDAILALAPNPYILQIKRKNKNAYASIDKLAEAHAANAPQKAKPKTSTKDIDFEEVLKQLKLYLPRNRLAILSLMKHTELVELLQLLKMDKLILGLKFFNKKKLLQFILYLPKEDLMKMLLKIFSREEILTMMPVKEFKKFFQSTKISQDMFIKAFELLPKHLLAQILEGITGKAAGNKTHEALMNDLKQFNKSFLVEGIMSLGKKQIMAVAEAFIKMDQSLFEEFSKGAFFRPLAILPKNTLIGTMDVLEPEKIINMLGGLPQNILAQLTTLIDPSMLSDELLKSHAGLLASMMG